jgi:hypothetical protein
MSNQLEQLRVQAIELRRAGKSRREIKELLQIRSNHVLNEALRGEPPPDWTGRPKAKDDLRARARELRRQVLIAGAVAYWCEGAKNKPYRRSDRIDFINSDPQLVKFFLRFLATAGVSPDQLIFRVSIHETADPVAAQQFWRKVIGFEDADFRPPLIKRHKPLTVRKNTGEDYHGCLRIQVRRSVSLYRQIERWASAAMMSPGTAGEPEMHQRRADDVPNGAPGRGFEPRLDAPKTSVLPG